MAVYTHTPVLTQPERDVIVYDPAHEDEAHTDWTHETHERDLHEASRRGV